LAYKVFGYCSFSSLLLKDVGFPTRFVKLLKVVNDPTSKECGLLVSSGNIVALHKAKSLG